MADKGPQKETLGGKARAFGAFIFNKEEGKVLGRDGRSWAEIGAFYIIYYACLAGFFAASLAIFYQLVDEKVPRLTGADSLLKANPALGYRPAPSVETTLIRFTDKPSTYQKYLDHLDSFLKPYDDQEGTVKCPGDNSPRQPSQYDKACHFDIGDFEDCSKNKSYGYESGKPCILIKMNRVYDWQPEAYSSKLNDDEAVPEEIRNMYEDYSVTVKCYGQNSADLDNLGPLDYSPKGFAYKFFPYRNQEGYVSPAVMVQFKKVKPFTLLMIECRAYAKNIKYDKQTLDGSVHFELLVDRLIP